MRHLAFSIAALLAIPAAAQDIVLFDSSSFGKVALPQRELFTNFEPDAQITDYNNEFINTYAGSILAETGRAVGRLDILTNVGHAPCTAFLIEGNRLITNYHCVPGIVDMPDMKEKGARAIFSVKFVAGYVQDGVEDGVRSYFVNPTPLEASEALDYSVLELSDDANAEFGALDLSDQRPKENAPFWVIGHPMGEAQRISRQQCQAARPALSAGKLRHTCDTLPGNSGSPVIDVGLRQVVALHHAGSRAGAVNFAIPMAEILAQSQILTASASGQDLQDALAAQRARLEAELAKQREDLERQAADLVRQREELARKAEEDRAALQAEKDRLAAELEQKRAEEDLDRLAAAAQREEEATGVTQASSRVLDALDTVTLRLQTHHSSYSPSGQAVQSFVEAVAEQSRGTLNIEVFYSASVVSAQETFDAAAVGLLDCDMTAPGFQTGQDVAFAAVGDLYGLYSTPEQHIGWLSSKANPERLVQVLYNDFNMHFVGSWSAGPESLVSTRPIGSLRDLKGFKLRSPPGVAQRVWQTVGATPFVMTFADMFTAIETGVIDGADASNLDANARLGLYDMAKYTTYPGFHSMPVDHLACNLDVWNGLDPIHQRILSDALRDMATELARSTAQRNADTAETLASQGVTLQAWSDADRAMFRRAALEAWDAFVGDSRLGRQLLDSHIRYSRDIGLRLE